MPPKPPLCFFPPFFSLTFSFFYCNDCSDYNTTQRHRLNPKKSSSSRSGNLAHTWPSIPRSVQIDLEVGVCDRVHISNRVFPIQYFPVSFVAHQGVPPRIYLISRYIPVPPARCSG
jgi:hypothetical protein